MAFESSILFLFLLNIRNCAGKCANLSQTCSQVRAGRDSINDDVTLCGVSTRVGQSVEAGDYQTYQGNGDSM